MNHTLFRLRPIPLLLSLSLAACGGGSGDEAQPDPPPAPPPPVTLSGNVAVNGLVQGAVVCLDINANNACDAGEPASAATGSDGAYTLSYDPSVVTAEQAAAASLIAPQVAAVTRDTASGGYTVTDAPFVLKQLPGKAGQINPLTTMLAKAVAGGMSEADARSNLTMQLALQADKIDDYQSDPPTHESSLPDTTRTAAAVVAFSMGLGHEVSVGVQTAARADVGKELVRLQYGNSANYNLRLFDYSEKAEGSLYGQLTDVRQGIGGGVTLTDLYTSAYLGPNGWVLCDENVPLTYTLGVPSRSTFCGASVSVGSRQVESLAGQSMASVVTALQSDPLNFINVGATDNNGLLSALGSAAVFPSGSAVRNGYGLTVNQPVFINNRFTDGLSTAITTLEELVAARPVSGVTLSTGAGTATLGGFNDTKVLRVAFAGSGNAVQFYICDIDAALTSLSNCVVSTQGTYNISTENGVRVMRFEGFPETTTNNIRMFAEVKDSTQVKPFVSGSRVFSARQIKPQLQYNLTRNKRLNGTATAAMLTQLGL